MAFDLVRSDPFAAHSAATHFQDADAKESRVETCTNAPIEDLPMVSCNTASIHREYISVLIG